MTINIRMVDRFNPIDGDDYPLNTRVYRNVNNGFKLRAIRFSETSYPLTKAKWTELNERFDKHYGNFEIVGRTEYDFYLNLENTFFENIDIFERYLQYYNSDMAKPIAGSMIKTTYDLTNASESSGTSNGSNIDIPMDNPSNENPSSKTKASTNGLSTATQTGTQTVENSLAGERFGVEILIEYTKKFQSYTKLFISFFKDDFRLYEVYK